MKKTILLFSILLSILQGKAQLFHEDFEVADSVFSSGTPGWFSNNRLSVGGLLCDSASIQNAGDTTSLTTLSFNCSGASKVFLSFDHICKVDLYDRATIEISNDSGATFQKLDNSNCYYAGDSWFFQNYAPYFCDVSYLNWVPSAPLAIPDNSWWHYETFNLSSLLAGKSNAIIKFKLFDGNNNGGVRAGWFIDNLKVDTFATADIGVQSILNFNSFTISNANHPADITIKNFGADTVYSFDAGYIINFGTPVSQSWSGILAPGDTVTLNFPPFNVPLGSYSLCSFTNMVSDTVFHNDTLCMNSYGLPILTIPYSEDFEGANAGWVDPNPMNDSTVWELGTPNYGVTNSAHSGIKSWDTNLDTSYFNPANALLYSPFFDFSTVGNASLSFWQNRKTEPLVDGFRLEYSINSGSWQILGLANNPLTNNWYTDSAINSTTQPGWEGNSNGWTLSSYPLPSALSNQASVQFRFVFSADNTINSDGVSIDDFSISFAPCGNTINYSAIPTSCGDSVTFNYTASSGIASQFWDLGNGQQTSQVSATGFYTTGSYNITLYTIDSTGCAASSVMSYTALNGFTVDAGPDVYSCGAGAVLSVIPSLPGNAYTYGWTPIAGLNNPFISNPTASHVDSLTYTVTVTDSVTGCSSSDQIMVSAYSGYSNLLTICLGGATVLDMGPGGLSYLWQTFTDTLGNVYPINLASPIFLASLPGTYAATATFPLCGIINSTFHIDIDTSCITDVWPGDCNYDQVSNNKDFLNIGLAYGISSTVRPGATLNWIAQPSPDWPYYFINGINYKHSDCNGNGTVDSFDVQGILQNYSLLHPLKPYLEDISSIATPAIYLTADLDTAGISDTIHVFINLGTTTVPVDSIYGIAFTVSFESILADTNYSNFNYSTSWLGTPSQNLIGLEKNFLSQGFSDFGLTRFDHANVINGSGTLAVMTIVTTDNLSGKTMLHFNLSDVKAITTSEYIIPLTTLGDSVVMDPNFTGVSTIDDNFEIVLFPNPVKNSFLVKSNHSRILSLELKNALGQVIRKINTKEPLTRVDVSDQPTGILFLSVLTDKGVISKKVQVLK